MSIHFISGKPGGGKSMYSVKMIIDELAFGTRTVVTNVALNLGRLNEYLQETYPSRSVNLLERMRVLTDEETGTFWTCRGNYDCKVTMLAKEQWQRGEKPDYSGVADAGVMYAIDEVHNFFNARAWMETGRDVLFYLSQHRKLGDTVICITQAVENVDKQFRSVTQDFTYLRNLTKEKFGLFVMPAIFVRKTYGSPATNGGQALESGTFKLDVRGIGSCYDTAKGVGIHGKNAGDVGEKKKGVRWYWFVILVPIILIMLAKAIPYFGGKWFSRSLGLDAKPVEVQTNAVPARSLVQLTNAAVVVESPVLYVRSEAVEMVGFSKSGGVWEVMLSDGTITKQGQGRLTFLTREYAVVDGVTNKVRTMARAHELEIERQKREPLYRQPVVEVKPYAVVAVERKEAVSQVIIFGRKTEAERPAQKFDSEWMRK